MEIEIKRQQLLKATRSSQRAETLLNSVNTKHFQTITLYSELIETPPVSIEELFEAPLLIIESSKYSLKVSQ